MKPNRGLASRDTEVWIKGKGFGERVEVLIGDQQATIVETYENLIVAIVPARHDLMQDTMVPVTIANKNKNGASIVTAENKIDFIYKMHLNVDDELL